MPANVKGYRMKYFIEEVKKQKGDSGVAQLQSLYGNLQFVPTKNYSETENIALIRAATKVLFGKEDSQSLFQIGQILARRELQSAVMQIGLKIVKPDSIFRGLFFNKKVLDMIERSIPIFAPSLKVKVENPDPKTLVVTFFDTLMPPKVYEGEWYEFFQALCGNVTTSSQVLNPNSFCVKIVSHQFKNIEKYLGNQKIE